MTSPTDDGDQPESPIVDPYEPFPAFVEWVGRDADVSLLDDFLAAMIASKDSAVPETWERMLDTANKWAAVDTGAIENLYDVDRGFTYTVAATTAAWARIPQEKGEEVARVMADQLSGYEYVLDAATRNVEISEYWIKQLHSVLCASQETYKVWTELGWQERLLPKGEYKKEPNNPLQLATNHIHGYAAPLDVVAEMGRLVQELREPQFLGAPAIVKAAYAHYAFVCVHPFVDGNGRVSRALASVFLYQDVSLPLVIFADQKSRYLDALEFADQGDAAPFVQFIRDCVIDSVNLVKIQLERAARPPLEAQKEAFRAMLLGRGGLTHMQVDEAAGRLSALLAESIQECVATTELPETLRLTQVATFAQFSVGQYRRIDGNSPAMQLVSASPASGSATRWYATCVAKPETEGADFVVIRDDMQRSLAVFLREVFPTVTEALRMRVAAVVESDLQYLMDEVQVQAIASLRNAGYAV